MEFMQKSGSRTLNGKDVLASLDALQKAVGIRDDRNRDILDRLQAAQSARDIRKTVVA